MLLSEKVWISNRLLHGDDGGGNRTPDAHVLLCRMSNHNDVHDDVHDDVRENFHNGIHDDVRENVSFLP